MAHNIESMFFQGETPWHGLGTKIERSLTAHEAMVEAGLNWEVNQLPLFLADGREAPAKANIRSSDGSILGVVGSRYKPLQNIDAFDFFDPFLQSGLIQIETAGSLSDGKKVWALARITGDDIIIVGDDVVRRFILLSNSHDGTAAIRVGFTPIRVVCANSLAQAHHDGESKLIRLRHSSRATGDLSALRDTINIANQSFEATAAQFRALAARQINRADLEKYIIKVMNCPVDADGKLSTRSRNTVDNIVDLFDRGRGADMKSARGTVWGAYNAITEHLSHEAGTDGDKRYTSLWFGQNAGRNTLALAEALKLAA